jgi:PAS domain S-box-containing protein
VPAAPAPAGPDAAPLHGPGSRSDAAAASINALADPCFRLDTDWVIRAANPALGALVPAESATDDDRLVGSSARSLFTDAFGAVFNRECARALRTGLPARFEEQYLPRGTWLEVYVYPDAAGATVLMHDAADRRRAAELLEDQTRVLERIARGRPLAEVLDPITGLAERHVPGLTCPGVRGRPAGPAFEGGGRPGVRPRLPADPGRAGREAGRGPAGPGGVHPAAGDRRRPRRRAGRAAVPRRRPPARVPGLLVGPDFVVGRGAARGAGRVPAGGWAAGRRAGPVAGAAANLAGIALERQLVEADLRQKEEQYRSIVETVQDGLVVADVQGTLVEANPAAARIHGGPRESLAGRRAADLVRPDYHGVLRRLLDEVRQGREYRCDLVGVRRDGSSFPAEVTAVPFLLNGQRHALGLVRDVTARKSMEDSLRRTEERLRTVANGAPLVLFSLDRAGVFTLSEGQALASLGLRPGEVVGRSAFDLYGRYPDVAENLRLALGGEPRRFVTEIGEQVFETIVRPLRAHGGAIVGAVGVAIDVTEQTLTAEALRESEERFRASFHQAPLGVAHASLDGVVLRANDRLGQMLGVSPNEVVGRRVGDWYAGDAAAAAVRADEDAAGLADLLAGRADVVSAARSLNSQASGPQPVVLSTSLVRGRQGEPRSLIVTVTPVPGPQTERV